MPIARKLTPYRITSTRKSSKKTSPKKKSSPKKKTSSKKTKLAIGAGALALLGLGGLAAKKYLSANTKTSTVAGVGQAILDKNVAESKTMLAAMEGKLKVLMDKLQKCDNEVRRQTEANFKLTDHIKLANMEIAKQKNSNNKLVDHINKCNNELKRQNKKVQIMHNSKGPNATLHQNATLRATLQKIGYKF
jgi:uncharacterized coiled-coil protein SlyX